MENIRPLFEPEPSPPNPRREIQVPELPPPAPRSRHRLWLLAGALAGATALIGATVYFPKHGNSHPKSTKGTVETAKIKDYPAPSDASNPSSGAVLNGSSSAAQSDAAIANATAPVAEPSHSASGGSSAQPRDSSEMISAPGSLRPPDDQVTVATDPSASELEKLGDETVKLNARAAAISASIDTLRQQQEQSGLNLRGDVSSAYERMRFYLSHLDSALRDRDAANARKYLGLAETEASKLEKFLGH